jgi:hypothetical protein
VLNAGSSVSVKDPEWLIPTTSDAPDEWKFNFHGYLRAPMRISFGPPSPVDQPPNGNSRVVSTGLLPADAPPGTQWHSWPRVPGASYISWDYTNTVPGPWAQLNFSYGNARTMMTVIVDSYAQTSGGYRDLQAQQGIDQAFITLNFPDLFGNRGGLVWNVGSFQNRYGTAGKYDGGMYETYLFGRTHVAGETLTANVEFGSDWSVTAEQGFGAKMEVIPFTNNQLGQVFKGSPGANCFNLRPPPPDPNNPMPPPVDTKPLGTACVDNNGWGFQQYLSDRDAEYLPYAGPVPQGSTFLAHFHLGLAYRRLLTFGAHLLYTFTPDDNWSGKPNVEAGDEDATHLGNSQLKNVSNRVPRVKGPARGSMLVTGAEVRLSGGVYGDGYLGYSYIDAKNINALADALEVLHSFGGWQFKENFFGVTFDPHTGQYQGPQNETGTVQTIEGQYTFSFGALVNHPAAFWGQGPDLTLTAFGMLTLVNSPAPVVDGVVQGTGLNPAGATVADWNIKTKKLKFGADALYTPLSWIGVGGRFDMVQPDLDAKFEGSQRNFEVLSPRLVFKTQFVTHEAITLSYQRYFVGSAARAGYPNAWVARPDLNLVALAATMWW